MLATGDEQTFVRLHWSSVFPLGDRKDPCADQVTDRAVDQEAPTSAGEWEQVGLGRNLRGRVSSGASRVPSAAAAVRIRDEARAFVALHAAALPCTVATRAVTMCLKSLQGPTSNTISSCTTIQPSSTSLAQRIHVRVCSSPKHVLEASCPRLL